MPVSRLLCLGGHSGYPVELRRNQSRVEAAQRVSEAWVTGIIQTASLFLTPRLGWWKFSIAVMDTSLCINMKFVRSVGRVSRLKGGGMIVQLRNTTCTGGKRSMTDDRIRSRDRPA